MTNSKYRKGRNFEYAVKHYLEDIGYTVLRTAGSHGEFDLIAYAPLDEHKVHVIFIQCKASSGEMRILEQTTGVFQAVWLTKRDKKGQAAAWKDFLDDIIDNVTDK